jgi:hypothetical protein
VRIADGCSPLLLTSHRHDDVYIAELTPLEVASYISNDLYLYIIDSCINN